MTTIFAIAVLGVALFAVCALAVKLTKDEEKQSPSMDAQSEKSEDEKALDTYPHMYMDGGGLWGDPFSPFSPYNHL